MYRLVSKNRDGEDDFALGHPDNYPAPNLSCSRSQTLDTGLGKEIEIGRSFQCTPHAFVLRYGKNGGNFIVFVRCTRATTSCVVESVKAGVGVQVQYIQKTFVVVFSVKTRSLLSLRYLAESVSAERKLSSSIREVARSYRRLSPHPLNTVCVSRPRKVSTTCFLFLFCCLFGLGDGASSWWEVPTWEEDWQWLIWRHLLG